MNSEGVDDVEVVGVTLSVFALLLHQVRHLALSERHEDAPSLFLRGYSRVDDDLPQRACLTGKQESAAAAGESEYRDCIGVATSPGNRSVNRGQNPENTQVVWPVQERGRFARDQRHWAGATGKNAQVRNCRQIPCPEEAGEQQGYLVSAAIYCQVAAARVAKHHGAKSADAELKREPTSRKRTDRKVGHYKSKNVVRRRKNIQILHQSTW